MSTQVYAHTYNRAHSIIFLSDNLRTALRDVILEYGLSPDKLVQDWETIERGIDRWLNSGHLTRIVVEFYKSGAAITAARWEFPIGYSGSGAHDDMWLDKAYLRQIIVKSARPTRDCIYRVILCTSPGAPAVAGFEPCSFLSTGQLAARHAGTVIATSHLTAGALYWR